MSAADMEAVADPDDKCLLRILSVLVSLLTVLRSCYSQGVMAKRVMNLLWSMMMNPEAPSEVSKSPAITDALQAYANRKGLVNNEITYEYMRQCISAIQAGTGVLAAMSLLHRLIQTSVSPRASPARMPA